MRATILPKDIIIHTDQGPYLCNYNVIVFISCQEGNIAAGILPTSNTSLSSLPVGSKEREC